MYIISENGNNIYIESTQNISGDDREVDTPVPIPNTAVKHLFAKDTWRLPSWKIRVLPEFIFLFSSVGRALGC